MKRYVKDPDAALDYGFDWSKWLDTGEVVAISEWEVASGLTGSMQVNTGTVTQIRLSGGVLNQTYSVVNRITTSSGQVDDRTLLITVRDK